MGRKPLKFVMQNYSSICLKLIHKSLSNLVYLGLKLSRL